MKTLSLLCILLTGYAYAGLEVIDNEEVYVIEHDSFAIEHMTVNGDIIRVGVECIADGSYAAIQSHGGWTVPIEQQDISSILYLADIQCRWIGAYE